MSDIDHYSKVPIDITMFRDLSDAAHRLYTLMAYMVDYSTGRCKVLISVFGSRLGWSNRKVCRYIRELESLDYLVRINCGQESSMYLIRHYDLLDADLWAVAKADFIDQYRSGSADDIISDLDPSGVVLDPSCVDIIRSMVDRIGYTMSRDRVVGMVDRAERPEGSSCVDGQAEYVARPIRGDHPSWLSIMQTATEQRKKSASAKRKKQERKTKMAQTRRDTCDQDPPMIDEVDVIDGKAPGMGPKDFSEEFRIRVREKYRMASEWGGKEYGILKHLVSRFAVDGVTRDDVYAAILAIIDDWDTMVARYGVGHPGIRCIAGYADSWIPERIVGRIEAVDRSKARDWDPASDQGSGFFW